MKAMHHPSRARPLFRRRGMFAFAAPAAVFALGTAITIASLGGDAIGAPAPLAGNAGPKALNVGQETDPRDADDAAPARRWPAEIEQLLSSSVPHLGDDPGEPPTVETDQRCSRVEDGLAHCVMLECQTARGRTTCFEMVVTARRLREAPDAMRDDEGAGAFEEPIPPTSSL